MIRNSRRHETDDTSVGSLYRDTDGGTVPVPDPTRLTQAAVDRASEQWKRDLDALRERFDIRLAGMDEATRLRLETAARVPGAVEREIGHLRELHNEKFEGIDLRFVERDTRTEQIAVASEKALAAALQAAKELVTQQNEANAAAATKAETNFTKQIDQIGVLLGTLEKGFSDRLTTVEKGINDRLVEIKERIDRGEGSTSGVANSRTERRLDVGVIFAALSLIAAALIVFAAFHK